MGCYDGSGRSIPAVRGAPSSVGVLVPVKSFTRAKQRLAGVLTDAERADLAQWCAGRVLAAAAPMPVHVVCDDETVAAWAEASGASVIWCPGVGLNPAIERAVTVLAEAGYDLAVVVHGDLPLARHLHHVAHAGEGAPPFLVTAVPDHRYDGTNVLAVPTRLAGTFQFQYGSSSFRRHVRDALRCGASVRVVRDLDLAHDLDTPDDLDNPLMEDVRQWLRTNRANPR